MATVFTSPPELESHHLAPVLGRGRDQSSQPSFPTVPGRVGKDAGHGVHLPSQGLTAGSCSLWPKWGLPVEPGHYL